MARQLTKRKLVERPGLLAAAAALGCNYSHLRRVVIGDRQSESLLARYHEFKKQPVNAAKKIAPSKTLLPPPIEFAAMENLAPCFFSTLSSLKLEVVIVRFAVNPIPTPYPEVAIAQEIERELQSIRAGYFDASIFPLGSHWHFFHVGRAHLGKAMQKIKDFLATRELLPITMLLHAETASELRQWYPGDTAALISAGPDTEE
jgi:hypothetical protein